MRLKVFAILLLLVVGGAAVFVGLGGLPRGAAAATSYLTATAAITNVRDDVAATGTIASSAAWDLAFGTAPTASGSTSSSSSSANGQGETGIWTVSAVSVAVGDAVKKDQVLATAANADLARSIAAARNDWTVAALNEDQAHQAYDDAVDNGRGDDAIRQARTGWLNAKNQLASAHQSLLDFKAAAARNRLVSPAAGVVTAINVSAGLDAPSGAAITIAASSYQVTADVVESDITALKLQQPATVSVSAIGATLDGTVTAIAPTASSGSGSTSVVSYAVTVALQSPPATLRAGMTADLTITTASASDVLAVPAAAIRGTTGNYTVLVMTASGTPEARPVTVGLMTSSLVEIQSGLSAGDVVVTGTSSTQRSTTSTGFGGGGGGGFVVPGGGGGGGRFNGGGGSN
jgi:membrane fusion protein, macrolide-specific efflux system